MYINTYQPHFDFWISRNSIYKDLILRLAMTAMLLKIIKSSTCLCNTFYFLHFMALYFLYDIVLFYVLAIFSCPIQYFWCHNILVAKNCLRFVQCPSVKCIRDLAFKRLNTSIIPSTFYCMGQCAKFYWMPSFRDKNSTWEALHILHVI